ncbi:aromatase [Gigaspora margarita]|uniref:Aromatase n=1 Tax=Gigaspora margarita TaxID=4874 RepID=A0A8H4AV33_GIGMA|nr:aromatase [Gigaspora margarita]
MFFPTNVLITIIFTILSVFLYDVCAQSQLHQPFRGPPLNILTRLIIFIQLHFFLTVPEFTEFWCRLYGDTVGVWMNGEYTIITCDAELVQQILDGINSKNFIMCMGNDHGLKELGMYQNVIVWNNDVSKWTLQKHIFQALNAHHKASMTTIEKTRQEINRIKISVLKNNVLTVDILNVIRHITLAIILEVSLGIQLDSNKSQYLIDCILDYFKAWKFFLMKPRFMWPLFPLQFFHHRKSILKFREEIQSIISILDPQSTIFLRQLHKNNLTDEEIQSILEMVLASTDSVSVSLYYTILFLTENKKIVNQLMDSSDDSFLDAVLQESMRIALLNRCQKWFEIPLKFDPQRFIQNESSISLSVPMGHGPISCVGQHIAMVEMKTILFEFFKEFIFTRMDETRPIIDTKTRWDIVQRPIIKEVLNLLPRKKIVFIGAQSVGKTTLANFIKSHMNGIMISETARIIMKELNLNTNTMKILRNDPDKTFEFQATSIKVQCEKEDEIEHEFAILDRCALDSIVYAQKFCKKRWRELLDMKETNKCIERYRQKDRYIIFLIEPQKECLEADGTRSIPTNYEEWISFSDSFKMALKEFNIEFNIINVLDINQRYSIVKNALFAHNI